MKRILKKATLMAAGTLLACATASAQTVLTAETQLSLSSGDHTPLWLNANKYGLSSLDTSNGYVRAALMHAADTTRTLALAYGADVAVATGYTSTLVVQQAFAELRWHRALLTVGSKQRPLELKNAELSSGGQALGINARPIPEVMVSVPDYYPIPLLRNKVAVKGHLAYGRTTDDNWQQDFTRHQASYTEHTLHHTKAGYLRIGDPQRTVNVELGLEMGCQFGGTAHTYQYGKYIETENLNNLTAFWRALIPSGGDQGEGIYKNKEGNHLGSYLVRVNINRPSYDLALYADHYFEDHSQMFFVDYDGYGEGEDFNHWKKNRWLLYDLRDIMLGTELHLKGQHWVERIVGEYVYTKYQSGPINHDRTPLISDHIAGRDDYYNHYIYSGWQHWGQVLGNPLYRSPLYNDNGSIKVLNNRFWAWHLGVSGTPLPGLHYRLLLTTQRGWGTYPDPLPDPQRNNSLLAEVTYVPQARGWWKGCQLKAAWGMDSGSLLGDNMGMQITLSKSLQVK